MSYANGLAFFFDLMSYGAETGVKMAKDYLSIGLPKNKTEREEELEFRRELATALRIFRKGE